MGFLMLILFIILVFIVWISLVENAKKYKTDLHIEEGSTPGHEVSIEIPLRSTAIAADKQKKERTAAEKAKPDDLTIIEGIGPKVSSALNKAGIFTLKQLSEAEIPYLKEILVNANYAYMDPSTWANQAEFAALGKIDDLKVYQDQLKAGRK